MSDVDHPAHYGGAGDPYEAIKVIEAWKLGFCLGNAVKYVRRAGQKPGQSRLKDLEKALWYLQHEVEHERDLVSLPFAPKDCGCGTPAGCLWGGDHAYPDPVDTRTSPTA